MKGGTGKCNQVWTDLQYSVMRVLRAASVRLLPLSGMPDSFLVRGSRYWRAMCIFSSAMYPDILNTCRMLEFFWIH